MNPAITGSTGPVGEELVRDVTYRWSPTRRRASRHLLERRRRHVPASDLIGSVSFDHVLGRLLRMAA